MSNTKHITDQLSAYLDNRLSAGDRARVEAHLRGCDQCRRDLAELGYTVNMVRALPVIRRPRSYTLAETPAAPHWALGWLYRLMGGATMAAALLFVVVLAVDMLSFGAGGAASPAPPVAMSAATAAGTTENAADSARASEAPKAAPTRAAAAPVVPTAPGFAPAPTVVPQSVPATAPTASPQPTGPSQPSTAGVISVTATATASPSMTPSPTPTATVTPTRTPTATPSPHPTATSTPPPPPRAAATAQPSPTGGIAPARLVEFALAVFVLGGLGLTLLLRALRPS